MIHFRRDFLGEELWERPELRAVLELLDASRRGIQFTGECRDEVAARLESLETLDGLDRLLGFLEILGCPDGPRLGVAAARAAGIDVADGHAAYRADFVTADDTGLRDVTGGGIDDPEAQVLLEALASAAKEATATLGNGASKQTRSKFPTTGTANSLPNSA